MKTILEISEHLKNFGEHMFENGALKPGYADLFTLLAIAGITSIVLYLLERRSIT